MNIKFLGIYEGSIYMMGKLEYNFCYNVIDIKSLKYIVDLCNFLLCLVVWLLKGKFKNSLEENLNFYFDYNLIEIKE